MQDIVWRWKYCYIDEMACNSTFHDSSVTPVSMYIVTEFGKNDSHTLDFLAMVRMIVVNLWSPWKVCNTDDRAKGAFFQL